MNQGGLGLCDPGSSVYNSSISAYCEFEKFFEEDISNALNISYYRVKILFIKLASLGTILLIWLIILKAC